MNSWKIVLIVAIMAMAISVSAQVEKVKHIVLSGCDGLGTYAIPNAEIPNLKALMSEGSSSLKARSVLPSSSAVNWASMILGAGPIFYCYIEWGSQTPEIPSVITTQYGFFLSIFSVIRNQKPTAKTASIYSWPGVGYLIEKKAIHFVIPTNNDAVINSTVRTIKEEKPLFTFVHLDEPDGVGHNFGHHTWIFC